MPSANWVAARAVELSAVADGLRILEPNGYDEVLKALEERYRGSPSVFEEAHLKLNREVRRLSPINVLNRIVDISKTGNVRTLLENLEDVCESLARDSIWTIQEVQEALEDLRKYDYPENVRRVTATDEELFRAYVFQWKMLIRETIRLAPAVRENSLMDAASVEIAHVTDIGCARRIVSEGFRVSPRMIASDRCANFYLENIAEGERSGCTLYFIWRGPILDTHGGDLDNLEQGILYRNDTWRCILLPGTEQNLTFTNVTFQGEIEKNDAHAVSEILNRRDTPVTVSWW